MDIKIEDIIQVAHKAGEEILEIYQEDDLGVEMKEDDSPVTIADKRANEVIEEGLKSIAPDIPILSEEAPKAPYAERKKWEYCWIVDPVDGTKEFINRNGQFAINIALVKDKHPVVGVIYVPAQSITYYAEKGKGAFKQVENLPADKLPFDHIGENSKFIAGVSRSHLSNDEKEFINSIALKGHQVEKMPLGASLKHGAIAEGTADFYIKYSGTSEWDIAAGQIIVEETGGAVIDLNTKQPLIYNKATVDNPDFIMFRKGFEEYIEEIL